MNTHYINYDAESVTTDEGVDHHQKIHKFLYQPPKPQTTDSIDDIDDEFGRNHKAVHLSTMKTHYYEHTVSITQLDNSWTVDYAINRKHQTHPKIIDNLNDAITYAINYITEIDSR
jgi:hypothetical protein